MTWFRDRKREKQPKKKNRNKEKNGAIYYANTDEISELSRAINTYTYYFFNPIIFVAVFICTKHEILICVVLLHAYVWYVAHAVHTIISFALILRRDITHTRIMYIANHVNSFNYVEERKNRACVAHMRWLPHIEDRVGTPLVPRK